MDGETMKILHRPADLILSGDLDLRDGRRLCRKAGLEPDDVAAIRRFGPVVVARLLKYDEDGRVLLNRRRDDRASRLVVRRSAPG